MIIELVVMEDEGMSLQRVISLLREGMSKDKAYYTKRIAKILNISIPATRRYLKILENIGLLVAQKEGRYKVYALPDALPPDYEERIKRVEKDSEKKV